MAWPGARVAERYFGPEEVERLIPRLTRIMERVMAAQTATTEAKEWLQQEQRRIEMAGGGMIDQPAWRAARERVDRGARDVQQGLEQVQALGGVPKDLGLGLVDFIHLRDGREVNLCWRYGEEKITHWHGLDEGYASRKPL
jgi:hypothetical protein